MKRFESAARVRVSGHYDLARREDAGQGSRTMTKAFLVLGLIFLFVGLAACNSNGDSALMARIPTLVYSSYLSEERGIEFSYPASWVQRDKDQLIPFFVSPDGAANVGVTREALPQAMSTNDYFEALDLRLKAQGYVLGGLRQMQVGRDNGLQALYLNGGFAQVFVIVVKDQVAWSLIQTARAEEFIDWAHTFGEVAHSFELR